MALRVRCAGVDPFDVALDRAADAFADAPDAVVAAVERRAAVPRPVLLPAVVLRAVVLRVAPVRDDEPDRLADEPDRPPVEPPVDRRVVVADLVVELVPLDRAGADRDVADRVAGAVSVALLGVAAAVPGAGFGEPPAGAELLPEVPVLVGVVVAIARLSFRCMPWFRAASSRRCSGSRRL